MYVLSIVVYPFVRFLLTLVLSILLRYADCDYPFGIFKFFSQLNGKSEMTKRQINNGTQHTAIPLRGIFVCLFIYVLFLEIQFNKEVRIILTGCHWRSN